MWRRRKRPLPPYEWRDFDGRDRTAVEAALALVGSECTSLTVNMCWHGGAGHDYPAESMEAARRLRERHAPDGTYDDNYTSLTFVPSSEDLADFLFIAPHSDLAYAVDADGAVVLEVSGDGASGSVRSRLEKGDGL